MPRLLSSRKIVSSALQGIKKAQAKDLSFLDWINEIQITLRGIPFSFDGHEYLREPYTDQHPDEIFMKGAQVGISTRMLLRSFWLCDTHHAKVIYFFPTDTDVSDFSNDRARPMIEENEYLKARVRGIDNVGLKHFGDSSIYFRGMFSRGRVKSVDADYIVLDELDEADQENKEYAQDRILHSKIAWTSQLSQPSIPDFGISQEFDESDQRVWAIKCDKCNHWNYFNPNQPNEAFDYAERFLNPKTLVWTCVKCGRGFGQPYHQQWISLAPANKDKRGYHLTQLYSSIIPIPKIIKSMNNARTRRILRARFFNSILGIAYTDEIRQPVTDAVILKSQSEHGFFPSAQMSFMGIDVGDVLHIVIGQLLGDKIQPVHLETTSNWSRLPALMNQFDVRQAVIDAMPYKPKAKDFAREFPGRVVLQYFKTGREEKGDELVKTEEDGLPVIRIGRTESLDDTTAKITAGEYIFPNPSKLTVEQLNTYELFKNHLKKLIKDLKEDEKGNRWFEYKFNVPNHFGMALNSMRLAIEYNRQVGKNFYGAGIAFPKLKP